MTLKVSEIKIILNKEIKIFKHFSSHTHTIVSYVNFGPTQVSISCTIFSKSTLDKQIFMEFGIYTSIYRKN